MRKKLCLIMLIMISTFTFASCGEGNSKQKKESTENKKKMPIITFEKMEHDFGNIPRGIPVETIFKFTNTGNAPLVITKASSSCGCTVPKKPEGVINPGEKSEIRVSYNASGGGQINKLIYIECNTTSGREVVKIKAFVEEEIKK